MTPLSPLAQQTAARTHATAPWRTWCCPLHLMGGFSPDRDARRGWLASAPDAADAAALPSFSDQTPKTRSAMCTADAALTAGLVQRLDADRVLVFRNARVLTMRGWQALPAHDVWVRHGRIEAVQPTGGALPEHALVVDASGKTLMPGQSDIHAHPFTATWAQAFAGMVQGGGDGQWYVLPYALQLWELLACGITRIEVMAGCPDTLWMRDSVRSGQLAGPRLSVGSPLIDGAPLIHTPLMSYAVADLEGGRQAGEVIADLGYDFAKPYSHLPAEGYEGLMQVLQRRGVRVMGHVPVSVGVEAAVRRGQQGIAHSAELFYNERGPERHDPARLERLARVMAEHGTWLQGTVVVSERVEALGGRRPLVSVDEAHMPTFHQTVFHRDSPMLKMMAANPEKQYLYDETYRLSCLAVAAAHRAGVRVLTGTDYPNPYVVAGYSLHEELVHLTQQCGLMPHEALHASTRRAAEYHGGAAEDGLVAVGGIGDLVLLDGNPLDDIHHTRRVHAVLAGAHYIGPDALAAGKARIALAYAAMPPVVMAQPSAATPSETAS
jgi:hypothetical protein